MTDADVATTVLLIRSRKSDDATALGALLERYMPRVREAIANDMGARAHAIMQAEDVIQEAFLEVSRSIERFQGDSAASFRHWLRTIIQNVIRMKIREADAEKRGGGQLRRFADLPSSLSVGKFTDRATSASEMAIGKEAEGSLAAALQRLSDRHRETIVMRKFDGLAFEEIAERLGLEGASSARSLFTRARIELARHLDLPSDG